MYPNKDLVSTGSNKAPVQRDFCKGTNGLTAEAAGSY